MSRSKKKNPIHGIAGDSDKKGKQQSSRMFRRKVNALLDQEMYDNLPVDSRELIGEWSFPKDGKAFCKKDSIWYEKVMRK